MGMVESSVSILADSDEIYETAGRKPNPVDIHVGSRVRYRRMIIGMSQEKLGEKMNLTFQQIQKYEKGTNRIGASRLFQLSKILEVPVGYFFEDAFAHSAPSSASHGLHEPEQEGFLLDFLNSREGLELNKAFAKIQDPKVRRRVIDLVRALSEEKPEAKESQPGIANDLG
ncbi:Cro/Cl family transcriptional regulator [Rhodomicrobium udaipurense JA643]|jgi:transcriptional regulator with XRE-family HTH domain|nr:Cro/Cl family transcriptional regulator [Rhodomicrobium udaipurense JA643]